MEEKFMNKIHEIATNLMDNVYIYFVVSVLLYFLGGVDETLIVLFCLNIIDIALGLLSNTKDKKQLFLHKIKIYIVIMLGVMMDKVLGIEGNTITRARTYIILAYSYNEIASIVNTLCMDESFFLPKGFRTYMKKIEKRGDMTHDEQDEQQK